MTGSVSKDEPRVDDAPRSIGRYKVVGRLATGGMAEILLGKLTGPAGFERAVVIKRILPHLARQPSFRSMFVDEARIAAQIRNSHVVQVYELGQEDDELFIVQEYLEGESAFGLLRRMVRTSRHLSPGLAASIVADACSGLEAAHELADPSGHSLGVVHRDVSPENVFITYDGGVKLLDFGVALARDRMSQTEVGNIKGKFGYMSPEQCRGQVLDRRSDVFSIGVVLHELVTGLRLFKRDNAMAAMQAICEETPPRLDRLLPECPEELQRICSRALERTREERYQTAAALRDDLIAFVRQVGIDDAPTVRATFMREVFADRIAEKRRLLQQLVENHTPTELPKAEVDPDVELLTVPLRISSVSALIPKPRRSMRLPLAIATIGVVAAGVIGYLAGRPVHPTVVVPIAEAPKVAGPVAAPPVIAPPPVEAPVTMVHLLVKSIPSGAHLLVDGVDHGKTPAELTLPRSEELARFVLSRDGYAATTRQITLERDQHVQVVLERPRRAATRHKTSTPDDASRFHRF